jgi:hypothetical protein
LPRKYLGARGNELINSLVTQASNKGMPITVGDVVNLNVTMRGSLSDPTIKTDLKESAGDVTAQLEQQAVAFAKARVDSAKHSVADTVSMIKQEVASNLKQQVAKQLFGTKDSTTDTKSSVEETKKKAESSIKNTLSGFLKKKKH